MQIAFAVVPFKIMKQLLLQKNITEPILSENYVTAKKHLTGA